MQTRTNQATLLPQRTATRLERADRDPNLLRRLRVFFFGLMLLQNLDMLRAAARFDSGVLAVESPTNRRIVGNAEN